MGICSGRHFLLTTCTLQLISTIERQVFDFLGFMWAPILVNFFNIIFVILGFFGAFQYRPRYIVSFCVWNVLWLGWNVFVICFYLNVGLLDKNSDILNLGTGSFSWWHVNGPGCKAVYDVTEPELFRPARPTNVTDCVLDYEVVEILHASTQCVLGLMAIVGGVCLSKVFMEEDDSFDFVGGDDFGLAGHTPLHPMYVSYSALPSPSSSHPQKPPHLQNYPTGTTCSSRSQSQSQSQLQLQLQLHASFRSAQTEQSGSPSKLQLHSRSQPRSQLESQLKLEPQSQLEPQLQLQLQLQNKSRLESQSQSELEPNWQWRSRSQLESQSQFQLKPQLEAQSRSQSQSRSQPQPQTQSQLQLQPQSQFHRPRSPRSNDTTMIDQSRMIDYPTDYSNPLDHLHRPVSPYDEYDSLDSAARLRNQRARLYQPRSPIVSRPRNSTGSSSSSRKSSRPRIFADHVREQPLRSFYSDPRLANQSPTEANNRSNSSDRDSRPLSLYASNL